MQLLDSDSSDAKMRVVAAETAERAALHRSQVRACATASESSRAVNVASDRIGMYAAVRGITPDTAAVLVQTFPDIAALVRTDAHVAFDTIAKLQPPSSQRKIGRTVACRLLCRLGVWNCATQDAEKTHAKRMKLIESCCGSSSE
jgi:hypothetical protein